MIFLINLCNIGLFICNMEIFIGSILCTYNQCNIEVHL